MFTSNSINRPNSANIALTVTCVQDKVVKGSFDNNSIAVQQALDELREDTVDVKQVKDHLQEIKKTKVSITANL